ncbi:MAG TPA: exopolysaccharide biosynthesis polyprenyl glycosylphosphotransferase [Rhizomicrobium sp.]|jgi:putative colanic acid biosynthesis UDP-glucose lipid carrier transferase
MSLHENIAGEWIEAEALPGFDTADAPRTIVRDGWRQDILKRALDLAVALPLLILLAPLLGAIAFWIALDSRGPVFFRQTRTGLGGRAFDIVKFRTMTVLENGAHVVQAKENDPRVTRAGRFLRKSSLDELPQLLNVIAGAMALVGPRPHALAHDAHYEALIDGYTLRQSVKPGITGWAQVHGLRGETPTLDSMKRRVIFDAWYAANASLGLDLEILIRTPFEVLRRRNAH